MKNDAPPSEKAAFGTSELTSVPISGSLEYPYSTSVATLVPPIAPTIHFKRHAMFFLHCVQHLPQSVQELDLNRMTLLYFAVAGLHLLNQTHTLDRDQVVRWVYAMQVLSSHDNRDSLSMEWSRPMAQDRYRTLGGFRPGPYMGTPADMNDPQSFSVGHPSVHVADCAHITMTQCALAILTMLGDDLSRVNRDGVRELIRACQAEDGGFRNVWFGSEEDVRFVYGACVICSLMGDWSGMNIEKTVTFLKSCQSFDGGIGDRPYAEGHGGPTYCAVSSLSLMGRLDAIDVPLLTRWILNRQTTVPLCGFNGRPNKDPDTCYSFWLGASLAQLGALDLLDSSTIENFTASCQCQVGGICKNPEAKRPDLLHTYLPLAALSLFGHFPSELAPLNAGLGFSKPR